MPAFWNRPSLPAVSVQEAAQRQDEGDALLVDVREADEYAQLRAEGAVFLPVSELGHRFGELPKDRPLLLICHSGGRSSRATAFMLQQGYGDVTNVEGGMMAWKRADLPMRSGPPAPGEGDF